MKINREDLAWAAGLFEGEGCISFAKGRSRKIAAMLNMTDRDVVEHFQSVVGCGEIYAYKPQQEGWKPQWRWHVGSFERVQALIAMLWPWLKSRRRSKIRSVLARYKACEPASRRLCIDRTTQIQKALTDLSNRPLWGRRWSTGRTQHAIAREFGVSPALVSRLKKGMAAAQ
jgi:hypothetical protein